MYPFVFLVSALAIIGSVSTLYFARNEPLPPGEGTANILADNLIVYADSVARFVALQPVRYTAPGTGNRVPDTSLNFPAWFQRNPRWDNKVIDGMVTVFSATPYKGPGLSAELAKRTHGSYRAGITANDREIISFQHGRTGIIVPTGIPANVPVYQVIVKQ